MVDLNQVALFVQVVEAGSFAEAARRLNMPANTLGRQVQQLESHLGIRLMQRSTRSLRLTEAGTAFHERSASQVEQLLAVAAQIGQSSNAPNGTVRVATTADFLEFFSAAWIAEFLRSYPDVRLDLVMSDARVDVIGQGIDVAFRGGEMNDSSLIARKLGSLPVGLVASPRYLSEWGTPRSLADLSEHDCIKSSKPGSRTTWRLVGPDGPAEVAVVGRLSAGTAQAQLRAAVAGLGIGMLPTLISCHHLRAGSLVEVLPEYGQTGVGIYAVYPSRKLLAPAVSVFIDFVELKLRGELLPFIEKASADRPVAATA